MRNTSSTISSFLFAALLGISAGAQAGAITITGAVPPGSGVPNGMFSEVPGACTVTFDMDPTTGTTSNACGVTFSGLGNLADSLVKGSVSGIYAAPAGDATFYLAVSPTAGSPVTLWLGSWANYFGFYAGSLDAYNSIAFFIGGNQVDAYTGTQLNDFIFHEAPSGNQTQAAYINYFAGAGVFFDSVVFSSTSNAFEVDNLAVAPVPVPATLALLGIGLLGLGFQLRRRPS